MTICGIVAEYNPFHLGHQYQLEEARDRSNADLLVVVMSGMFTQRGQAAIADKYQRCRMALAQGADMVIELPTVYALQPAEYFAMGAVGILHGIGANYISYGTEARTPHQRQVVDEFVQIANSGKSHPIFEDYIRDYIHQGHSLPAARLMAFKHLTQYKDEADIVLKSPNAILETAYLGAIQRWQSAIEPLPVPRIGDDYHQAAPTSPTTSATAIREMITAEEDYSSYMPDASAALMAEYIAQHDYVIQNDDFFPILQHGVATSPERLTYIPDGSDELCHRILNALPASLSYEEFVDNVRTRRYSTARVMRAMMHLILGINAGLIEQVRQYLPLYARILGVRANQRDAIGAIVQQSRIHVVTSPAKYSGASPLHDAIFQKDIHAANAYYIAHNRPERYNSDYTQGLIIT